MGAATFPLRGRRPVAFLLAALGVWAAALVLMAGPHAVEPIITAASLDLSLFVPVLYWLIVVRGAGAPGITVVPVFVLSVAATPLALPDGVAGALPVMRWLAVPGELLLPGPELEPDSRPVRPIPARRQNGSVPAPEFGPFQGVHADDNATGGGCRR